MQTEPNIGATIRLEEVHTVYFVGIGGIGMSAIARYFLQGGKKVYGYDKTRTPLCAQLEAEGALIHYTEEVNAIPKDAGLVIYTPAIPAAHAELVFYREGGYPVLKRSDVLQAITANTFNICVAGTHGKTTISAVIAHLLRHSGYGCTTFLGGISANYGTNFWSSSNDTVVVESDEYDRSFLKLSPDVAVISSMDPDHLDIYGTEEAMQDAFIAFGNRVKEGGLLLTKFGLKRTGEIRGAKKQSYSLQNDAAAIYAKDIRIEEGGYRFAVELPGAQLTDLSLRVGGMHNVENAVVAIAVADSLGIDHQKIREALSEFRGVRRRFEYVLPPKNWGKQAAIQPVLIDDYAHHPEELRALLSSVTTLFPQRLVTVIFQPHLFTRTRDLATGFAAALSLAHRVILLPIYPARELPIEGVTSRLILDEVSREDKQLLEKEALLQWMEGQTLNKEFGEVIVVAGAGDIDTLVAPLKELIENK
jgi:UDP-N-acetylmuramate--alanine ligase